MMFFLGFLCFIIAGLSEAIMDVLQFHYMKSPFRNFKNNIFWDPEISWRNKYKKGDPSQGPRFLGSKTLFVGLTDAWHLFKTIRTLFIFLGLFFLLLNFTSFWISFVTVAVMRIFFGLIFTMFYNVFQD